MTIITTNLLDLLYLTHIPDDAPGFADQLQQHVVPTDGDEAVPRDHMGIATSSNACYFATLMQCLIGYPGMRDVLSLMAQNVGSLGSFEKSVFLLLNDYKSAVRNVQNLFLESSIMLNATNALDLHTKVKKNGPRLKQNEQHDPSELYAKISQLPRSILARFLRISSNLRTAEVRRCRACNNERSREDIREQYLLLGFDTEEIDEELTLLQMIENYFSESSFVNEEEYRCTFCVKKVELNFYRKKCITKLPTILRLLVKVSEDRVIDAISQIKFPTTICFEGEIMCTSEESVLYELFCIIVHKGTMSEGHYMAIRLCADNRWRLFNDSVVTLINIKTNAKTNSDGTQKTFIIKDFLAGTADKEWHPYVFFYKGNPARI